MKAPKVLSIVYLKLIWSWSIFWLKTDNFESHVFGQSSSNPAPSKSFPYSSLTLGCVVYDGMTDSVPAINTGCVKYESTDRQTDRQTQGAQTMSRGKTRKRSAASAQRCRIEQTIDRNERCVNRAQVNRLTVVFHRIG